MKRRLRLLIDLIALAGLATCALGATNDPSPRAILAGLTREEQHRVVCYLYDSAVDGGAESRVNIPGDMILALGYATSFAPGQKVGEYPPWYKSGRVWAGTGIGAGAAGLGIVALNNGWLGNDPHYGRGTEAQQASAQQTTSQTSQTADTSGNGDGDRSVRQTINIILDFGKTVKMP